MIRVEPITNKGWLAFPIENNISYYLPEHRDFSDLLTVGRMNTLKKKKWTPEDIANAIFIIKTTQNICLKIPLKYLNLNSSTYYEICLHFKIFFVKNNHKSTYIICL